jgi:hypothetical protein
MQGPITVVDGGAYAGDAKIEDLQPGTQRLISYALDLDVEVAPEAKAEPEQLRKVSIVKGVLQLEHLHARRHKYTVKNSAAAPRELLIEYPLDPDWKLVAPQEPKEKTRNLYRFALAAEPGKEEERTIRQEVAISNLDDPAILLYVQAPQTSPQVKQALREVIRRKQEIQQVVERRALLEAQVHTIGQEQQRIRQNMAQLGRETDLYRRYVKKFGEQEDQVEKLAAEIERLQEQEAALRRALDEYLTGLEVG